MRRSLQDGSARYEILGRDDSVLEFRDIPTAMSFLRTFQDDPVQMAAIRSLVADHAIDVQRMDSEQVLTQAAALLINGRVKVLRSRRFSGGRASPDALGPKKADAVQAAKTTAKPKAWIEFKVVDDKTGEPVPGVELTIKLPDGSVEKRTTDAGGYVEVNDTLKGNCEVSCEIAGAESQTVYEFVRVD